MKKIVLLLVVCGAALFGCGGEEQQTKNLPIEQQFVIASLGHFVPPENQAVARAKELIERAAKTYGISKDMAADQAYTAYKIGQKDGITVTAMDVLEAATLAYVADAGMKFSESCAMYLTLRKSGMPHAEAMMGMKGLVTKIRDLGDASRR